MRYLFLALLLGFGLAQAKDLDVAWDTACAIRSGGLQCWGNNDDGQLGDGTKISRAYPAWVTGLGPGTNVTDVSMGYHHVCAVQAGVVKCWGQKFFIEDDQLQPAILDGLAGTASQVAVGYYHACALVDAGVHCWGRGESGALGDGKKSDSVLPVAVTGLGPGSGVSAITAGTESSCALVGGGVRCWGANSVGQLGNGSTDTAYEPTTVTGLAPNAASPSIVALDAGGYHACAVQTTGEVLCWGHGSDGQLGDGKDDYSSLSPVTVLAAGSSVAISGMTSISAGQYHTCAGNQANGVILCWGEGDFGKLGSGSKTDQSKAAAIIFFNDLSGIAAGHNGSCAQSTTETIHCWGLNDSGQLGLGFSSHTSLPAEIPDFGPASILAGGRFHTCALAAGTPYCWGRNTFLADQQDEAAPALVQGLPDATTFSRITSGGFHSCALSTTQVLYCWGHNGEGQLGIDSLDQASDPAQVPGAFIRADAGPEHSCAVTNQGKIRCWGQTAHGRLGNNVTAEGNENAPVAVVNSVLGEMTNTGDVAVGAAHSCSITSGTAFCWGANTWGALGHSAGQGVLPYAKPVQGLPAGNTVVRLALGAGHTCALLADSTVWCWGRNWQGESSGPATDSTEPHQVVGLPGAVTILTAGRTHTCAALQNGEIYCWGWNLFGQLGNGTYSDAYVPTKVLTMNSGATALNAGNEHTCASFANGVTECWGEGLYGRRGDGELGYRLKPSLPVVFNDIFTDGFENIAD